MSNAALTVNKEIVLTLEKSKEHLESLFEKMSEAWFVFDSKGKLFKANEAACKLLGSTPDYFDARDIFQIFSGNEELLRAKMKHVRSTVPLGRSVQFELRTAGTAKPGDYIWSLRGIRPVGGRRTFFVLSGHDITETKRYEAILRTIFSSLKMGIFIVNKKGLVEHNLTQYTQILLDVDKVQGQSFRELVVEPSLAHLNKEETSYAMQITDSLGDDEVWYSMVKEQFPRSLFRPGKVEMEGTWLGLTYFPINISGHAMKVLIIAEDKTEIMKAQRTKVEEERAVHDIAKRIVQVQKCPPEVLASTVDDIGALVERGDKAFEEKDVGSLCNVLHGIKSASRNAGFTGLKNLTHELEDTLLANQKEGDKDISEKDQREYIQLKKEIQDLRHVIKAFSGSTTNTITAETKLLAIALDDIRNALSNGKEKEAAEVLHRAKESYDRNTQSKIADLEPLLAYLVENTSNDQGKKCQFKAKLGTVKITKKQSLDIKEALVHVLNNAVAHGLEVPEERKKSGKPAAGSISVEAKLKDRVLTLLVADDGAGINTPQLMDSIVRSGLSSRDELEQLSEEEVWSFIFKSQLSTKEDADGISGRGIGMAAVKSVLKLYGDHEVNISSKPGQGTKMQFKFSL